LNYGRFRSVIGKSVARLSVMMLRVFMGIAGRCARAASGQADAAPGRDWSTRDRKSHARSPPDDVIDL
jgi:hypothetical protein